MIPAPINSLLPPFSRPPRDPMQNFESGEVEI
uniref:Uncharacterized protein n=1 Tax=Rhizophora mucronata TaxID=61149 RepID=A0A2P2NTJ7_RHIMU